MSHFLFVTVEGGGNVPPELGLARRLVNRGHRVTVLTDDCLAAEVAAAGCSHRGFVHQTNRPTKAVEHYPVTDWEFKNPVAGVRGMVRDFVCGTALPIARDMLDAQKDDPYDAVAGCGLILGPIVGAEAAGVPSVVLMANLDLRPVPGRPPNGPGLKPWPGLLGRVRDSLMDSLGRYMFAAGREPLQAARKELGLPPSSHPLEEYARAHRVLLLTSAAFDFPHEPLPKTVYAGPVLDDPSWTDDDSELLDELDGTNRPVVLATLGSTFQNQSAVYARVIEALGDLDVLAVVTLGDVFEPADFPSADHVRVVKSAPHGPILERASAALIHCGHGSVIKGLGAGVPLVCMPLGRDQNDNAARVEWHGAGLRLAPSATVERIRQALEKVLSTPAFAESAQRLAESIRRDAAQNLAVEELEGAATASRSPRGSTASTADPP